MYYSHIFNLNMNEWVPVKGRIEVVPRVTQYLQVIGTR